jgi:hypothetical protein
MKQLQFYKYATWFMVILNISMIAFFFLTRPPHQGLPSGEGGGPPFKNKAIDILKLDESQHAIFLKSVQAHRDLIQKTDKKQRDLLKPYFHQLIDPEQVVDVDSTLHKIQQLERNKIESTYQHFQEIKSILTPDQQADFEVFMKDALKMILMETEKKPPPPRGF